MKLRAGAATIDITPDNKQFLFGYPHVERYSTGINDLLFASALVLHDGENYTAFVTNDVIFVDRSIVASARSRISAATPIPGGNILISATHTHSAPITVDHLSNEADPAVPKADPEYRSLLEDAIVNAVVNAHERLTDARYCVTAVDATGIGTNRREIDGPSDLEVPVLYLEEAGRSHGTKPIACMVVCSMHPTVLHEDSTLISADFPGFARSFVQEKLIGKETPFLYHTGPAGNQSPRHVTRANNFGEAARLGEILGLAVVAGVEAIDQNAMSESIDILVRSTLHDLPIKTFPTVESAEVRLERAGDRLDELRRLGDSKQDIRKAEVDWFGAEETLTLARAARDGRVTEFASRSLPAEVMAVGMGPYTFIGLPGELFIEYSLLIRRNRPKTYVISLANGELQGYIVTADAAVEGGYEAANALFDHTSGPMLVDAAKALLER